MKRELYISLAASVVTAGSILLAEDISSTRLQSELTRWQDAAFHARDTGGSKQFLHRSTGTLSDLDVHLTIVNPGAKLPAPIPGKKEELLIMKEGSGEVFYRGEWTSFPAGSVLLNASYQQHGFRNTGITPASYYLITWTPPEVQK